MPIADYSVQLARRDGLAPTTARPPLLPALIASVYTIVGRGPVAFAIVRLLLACFIAVAGAMAVAISSRVMSLFTPLAWPTALAALVTLVLAALDRTARTYATDFLTEPLALFLTQLWLWCACELVGVFDSKPSSRPSGRANVRRSYSLALAAGAIMALLVATRSVIVLWLPGIWLMIWLAPRLRTVKAYTLQGEPVPDGRTTPSSTRLASIVVATCVLCCAPWWIRNCMVLQRFMPLGTQGSISLIGGYNDEALAHGGEWQVGAEVALRERVEAKPITGKGAEIVQREIQVSSAAARAVWTWTRNHERLLPLLAALRLRTEWNPYTGRALAWKIAAVLGLSWLLLLSPRTASVLGGVVLLNSLMVMLLYSVGGRFLVPTYGVLYTLAGIGIALTSERIRAAWRR